MTREFFDSDPTDKAAQYLTIFCIRPKDRSPWLIVGDREDFVRWLEKDHENFVDCLIGEYELKITLVSAKQFNEMPEFDGW